MLSGYEELEQRDTERNVQRVLRALSNEVGNLDAITYDWAAWNDTYEFVEDANVEYMDSNLVDGTFTDLRISVMLFVNNDGVIVKGKAVDLESEEEVPVPQSLLAHVSPGDLLLRHLDTESKVTGMVSLADNPMLVASRPILTSEDEGPIRGTLIMGRYLDDAQLEHLAEMTHLALALHPFDDPQMPPDFASAISSFSEGEAVAVQTLASDSVAGYSLLNDIYGEPAVVLRAEMPRDIYAQGRDSMLYYVLALVATGLVFGAVILFILEKSILSRLSHLSSDVEKIGSSGDLAQRVSVPGRDELSSLGGRINDMLGSLQASQQALQEREERYRLLADNVTDIIWLVDATTLRAVYVSPSVERLLGYSVEEAMALGLQTALTAGSAEVASKPLEEALTLEQEGRRSRLQPQVLELEMRHKDGSTVWTEHVLSFLRDAEGRATGILGVARDITERRQMQHKLQELYEEERQLRQDRETEIQKRADYTRALVHELKTPLTPMVASSELLIEDLPEGPLRKAAEILAKGALDLNKRIDELLDLARGEMGTLRVSPQEVDMLKVLNGVVDNVTPLISGQGQTLALDVPGSLPPVWADERRLRQVLLNLLGNACKFTPEAGLITLRARQDRTAIVVEVQDTGPGISEGAQEHLFDPYYQAEDGKARFGGLGLGLALCKLLIELHNGQIWVHSRPGEGSTFGFSVPLA